MKILIADDDPTARLMLQAIALENGFECKFATNGEEAITSINDQNDLRLILLDWEMPVLTGLEVCQQIRETSYDIPPYIILLTARNNSEDIVTGLKSGANDYVVKPFEPQELMARMDVGRRMLVLQNELYEVQKELSYQARYDALTGLPNRVLCLDRFDHTLNISKRYDLSFAALFIDLDHFKQVNDTYGHPIGDSLLCEVAERLQIATRDSDTVGRLSGDEFFILLENINNNKDIQRVIGNIFGVFNTPINLNNEDYVVSLSIGVSVYPADGTDADTLFKNADIAMYQAKQLGRNQCSYFTEEMSTKARESMEMKSALRLALSRDELELYYQPIIDVKTGASAGIEALARWHHPEKGWIPPDKFIPLAEESDLIVDLGEWVMRTACTQMKDWQSLKNAPNFISVNVSGKQITQSKFVAFMQNVIVETECPASLLTLEMTESFIMHESKDSVDQLEALRAMGLGIAIDDFGTGYSSLTYLKSLPVTKLKLDKLFVDNLPSDLDDVAIARAILKLAEAVELEVIAEGIENKEQHEFLAQEGCDFIQGYFHSKPMTKEQAEEYFS